MAAVPRSGTPQTSAAPSRPVGDRQPAPRAAMRRRLLAAGAIALAVALLFVAYLRLSRTYPENSDEANILLMSWDMLHGNVLLHGWYLSDVSFYPTELPQYALLEGLIGLHADTAHVAAAMTYTLAVLFAVLLARGPRDSRSRAQGPWLEPVAPVNDQPGQHERHGRADVPEGQEQDEDADAELGGEHEKRGQQHPRDSPTAGHRALSGRVPRGGAPGQQHREDHDEGVRHGRRDVGGVGVQPEEALQEQVLRQFSSDKRDV